MFSANLSMLFTEAPLLERFVLAKQAGFNAVEVQFPYEVSAESIRRVLDEQQQRLVLFNVDAADLLSGGEGLAAVPAKKTQFRQAVYQALEYVDYLKPRCINILPGRCYEPDRIEAYWETLSDNILWASDLFRQVGVIPLFEAINLHDMPGSLIRDHESMLALFERVRLSGCLLQYDIYHMARMGQDSLGFFSQHMAKIGHVQFADVPGRHEPGSGELNFKALFRALSEQGYQGFLGAEYKPSTSTVDSLDWWRKNDFMDETGQEH